MAGLALGALGIVYGDIGTSPLYAFREAFEGHHLEVTPDGVLGACSLVFWALIIIISVKYLYLVMRADNRGEGGILALQSLVPRLTSKGSLALIALGIFGTALLYGDGMITPAISVLGAVEGLGKAADGLQRFVIPIVIVILTALFLIQKRGTAGIGKVFGPLMFVWFVTIAVLGVSQIVREPAVLKAINPLYAVKFFSEYGLDGFWSLGSIFLVVTGGEALYADMGHFGRKPIGMAWFSLVLPSLVLCYFGMGALLIRHPEAIENPFYDMAPKSLVWPLIILATAAAVVASQALISGAFSLTTQAMRMDYLPRVKVLHTSSTQMGQVYVPIVNWILMIACIGLVLGFRTSGKLAAAYGIAVTMTMAITTLLFMAVAFHRWKWSKLKALGIGMPLLLIDLAFVGAQLPKIPSGGWFALVIGVAQFSMMSTWRKGRSEVAKIIKRGETPTSEFVDALPDQSWERVPGTSVFLFKDVGAVPPALLVNLSHNKVLHERVLLLSIETSDVSTVDPAERVAVKRVGPGIHQIVLTFGYMDDPNVPLALSGLKFDGRLIDPKDTTYFLGRETVVATPAGTMPGWQERLFVLQNMTAASAARFFSLPSTAVFEVGTTIEI